MEKDFLLKTPAAAEELGVKSSTLEQWRHKGTGPAFVKVGSRAVRYRKSTLDAFKEGLQEFRSTTEADAVCAR